MWRWMKGDTTKDTSYKQQQFNPQGMNQSSNTKSSKHQQPNELYLRHRKNKTQQYLKPEAAAQTIQRVWRGHRTRKLLKALKILKREEENTRSIIGNGGRHDIEALEAELEVAKALHDVDRLQEVSKRCAELQETLTQRTIVVDGVQHGQSEMVRQQRKNTVKTILSLADRVDAFKEHVDQVLRQDEFQQNNTSGQ
eukprot:jgi/Galph1/4767/GphlegSOOS_G3418.1